MLTKIIDFYVKSNLHVGLACFSFIGLTNMFFKIAPLHSVQNFGFFATVFVYNGIKYGHFFVVKRHKLTTKLKFIFAICFMSFFGSLYWFLKLNLPSKCLVIVFFVLIFIYTIPIFKTKKNLRNQPHLKIYFVALCWVLATVFLSILNANIFFENSIIQYSLQRLFFVFAMILVFDLLDMKVDNLTLQTIPQSLGVFWSKILGCSMVVFGLIISLDYSFQSFTAATTLILFLVFASPKRPSLYSLFFAEAIPILWYFLMLIYYF